MKRIIIVLILVSATLSIYAQGSITIFAGYGQSSFGEDLFDNQTSFEQAIYIPVGIQAGYSFSILPFGSLFLGAEINHALSPFIFELKGDIGNGDQRILDVRIGQTVMGGLAKIKFEASNFNPFIRFGGGLYLGVSEIEYDNIIKVLVEQQTGEVLEDEKTDLKSAFGFNIGAGMDYKVGSSDAVILEFVYHIVNREADEENSESFKADNWAMVVGYQLSLN